MKRLTVRLEGCVKFVQQTSSVLNAINKAFKDSEEILIIQGRPSEHSLVARVRTIIPGQSSRIAIFMPMPITDYNFYVMCHQFAQKLAENETRMFPRFEEAIIAATSMLTRLENPPSSEQIVFLIKETVVPLHFMACEILTLKDSPDLRNFYAENLPLLAKEMRSVGSSTITRIGLGKFFNSKCRMSSAKLEEFKNIINQAYETALSGNMSHHVIDLVALMVKAHRLLLKRRKEKTADTVRVDDNKPIMYL